MLDQPLIAPSILSADFSRLGDEVREVERAGADWIHVDVMDGRFVPNLTIGPLVAQALRPLTKLPLDCHLMVVEPERWIEPFARAGADVITIHSEAAIHLDRQLNRIREVGCKVGISINPGSSLALIEEVLPVVDLVLVMSVNPGFGGQDFIPSVLSKIQKLSKERESRGLSFMIEVDGGIDSGNIRKVRQAGADVFVAGSAIFGKKDRVAAVAELRNAL